MNEVAKKLLKATDQFLTIKKKQKKKPLKQAFVAFALLESLKLK